MTDEHYTKSAIQQRGWTATMIENLLGDPDLLLDNPKYRSGASMKMYSIERVEQVEASDAFKVAMEKAEKRRASLRPSIEARRLATIDAARSTDITVERLEPAELLAQAINAYNRRSEVGMYASAGADPAFIERITVNYVRHELTAYDRALWENAGKIGVNDAVDIIRGRVYGAIAKTYPHLEAECTRQADRRGVEVEQLAA